jgi:phytoene dehydrogenase-like protein
MHNVSRALAEVLQTHGGVVQTNAGVAEILCEGEAAR